MVETLVDHSLVQFDVVDGRYVFLETVREYAAALLARSGQADVVHARLLERTAAFAHEVRTGLERADADALHRVGHADAAVLTALDHVLITGGGAELAAGIAVDLAFGWSLRGRCGEGCALVQRLAAALDPPPPALRWAHGFLAVYSGDVEAGLGLAMAAVEHAREDGRTAARARILIGMVQAFVDPAGAEPVLAEAVTLAERAMTGARSRLRRSWPMPICSVGVSPRPWPAQTSCWPRWRGSGTANCGPGMRPSAPMSRRRPAGTPRPRSWLDGVSSSRSVSMSR